MAKTPVRKKPASSKSKSTKRTTSAKKKPSPKGRKSKPRSTSSKAKTTKTTTKTKSRKAGDEKVTIDRRRQVDQHTGDSGENLAPILERRKKVQRRRQIDPTTCERDYSVQEVDFMNAMEKYKRKSGRMFPTCSEVLEVIRDLGYVQLTPAELAVSTAPFADAATGLVGKWGAMAIAVGAMISTFGALNANVCCASQVTMAAADDGLFPRQFSKKTSHNVPAFSLIIVGVLCSLLLITNYTKGLLGVYVFLILIATIMTLFAYIFSAMAALMLEVRDPKLTPAGRIKEGLVAVLAFGVGLWAIGAAGQESVYWAFMLLMLGLPVYVFVAHKNHTGAGAEAAK